MSKNIASESSKAYTDARLSLVLHCNQWRVFLRKHIGGGKRLVVPYYSPERRAALLKMLLPPLNLLMAEVSRREGAVSYTHLTLPTTPYV